MLRRTLRPRRIAVVCAVAFSSALMGACAMGPAERAGLRPTLPATSAEGAAKPELPPISPQASLYGLFLAGEAALEKGSSREAAFYLGRASELAPDAGFLKERAFTAALIAGDVAKAAELAPGPDEGAASTQRLGRVAKAVDLMARGKGADALAILAATPTQGSTGASVALLKAWAAAMAGDWTLATAPITTDSQLTRLFGALTRARLLERAGRLDEAEVAYRTVATQVNNGLFTLGYGAFLERRGRRAEAITLYEKAIGATGDVGLEHALARAKSGKPPALGSLQDGASETLLAPAALQMTRRQPEVALALLRLALRLDPDRSEAWMLVGDAMAAAGDAASAREAYAKVAANSAEYSAAQGRLAWSLQRSGDKEGALKLARAEVERSKDDPEALSTYADLLRENERFEDSVAVMDKLIGADAAGADGARLYYLRGVALERAGQWERAEADLKKAMALKPDDPDVLNYLGFAWADRSQHLTESLAMLEKAAALRPRSGEIRDSLGWARFRTGAYAEAVRDLERAVSLTPSDPAINDHLGDAYWRVGRRLEAEYQWRRVLTLEPPAELRSAVQDKLDRSGDGRAETVASAIR